MNNSSVPKVTEVDRVIAQSFYRVPCVRAKSAFGFKPGTWVPVFENAHTDPELDADFLQLHYDRRFFTRKKASQIPVNVVVGIKFSDPSHTPAQAIVWMERRCYSTDIRFLPEHNLGLIKERLEPIYQDQKMECGKCPHRGTPLNAIAPDENGVIHCPAHGLKWSAKTGEMVPIDC